MLNSGLTMVRSWYQGWVTERAARRALEVLRRRCEARLATLRLPARFDAQTFCTILAAHRRQPIILHPIEMPEELHGWLAVGTDADHIFYNMHSVPLQQEQTILHEASHILCGHQSALVSPGFIQAATLHDLSPELIQRVLRRADYTRAEEQEAELQASVIRRRARSGTYLTAGEGSESAAVRARLLELYARDEIH